MTPDNRLDTLKKFILESLPNDRVRHALLEIIGVLQEQKPDGIMHVTPRKKGLRHGTKENMSGL
jgi:hypothetical protein